MNRVCCTEQRHATSRPSRRRWRAARKAVAPQWAGKATAAGAAGAARGGVWQMLGLASLAWQRLGLALPSLPLGAVAAESCQWARECEAASTSAVSSASLSRVGPSRPNRSRLSRNTRRTPAACPCPSRPPPRELRGRTSLRWPRRPPRHSTRRTGRRRAGWGENGAVS
jgi:hypothetical protein